MNDFIEARQFLDSLKAVNFLEPNMFREQEEFSLFRKMVEEQQYKDLSGRLSGEVKRWDVDLSYAMSDETDEQLRIKLQVAEQMGMKNFESGLDSTFHEKRALCIEWWEQQSYDLKRRCLDRVITLLGKEKIDYAATQKYKEIADGIGWQNHHALKEACGIIEKLIVCLDSGVSGAETVVLRFEVDRLNKEVDRKKDLLKNKNKEIKMLRKRESTLLNRLGGG